MGNRLLVIILLIGIFAISGTWMLVLNIADDMLEEQARSESLAWAQFVRRDLRDLDHILRGAPPTIQDIQTLSTAKNVGNVVWFKIYDHDRTVVWAKDFKEIGNENTTDYFINRVVKGEKFVLLNKEKKKVFAHAFLPIMAQNNFQGAIEVSLNLSHIAESSQRLAVSIASGLAVLFVLLLIITGFFARREIQHERALKEDAQQAAKAHNDFIAMISHELRTPLNGVLGALGLLNEAKNQEETAHLIQTAIHSTEHLLDIINDIIDFTQVSAHRMSLHIKEVNLNEISTELETMFRPAAEEKDLHLIVENQLPVNAIGRTDLTRLRQIIFNLIANAIKFTQDGEVLIRIKIDNRAERRLTFDIIDTGIGMSKENQDVVFTKFKQVDNSLSRQYGGIGLGLSICKELAHLMGGDLTLESQLEKGSHFNLTLPFPESAEEENDNQHVTDLADTSLEILLAEDNPVNQKILTTVLEKANHRVTVANDGQEAIEKANEKRYDLILMDIQMPGLNGEEATRLIRENYGHNQTSPIIAISANTMEEQKESYLKAGMQGCLNKPIKPVELRQAVLKFYHEFGELK
ncbi:MAG: response regulator [Methylocystaceae bacterium]|nr:response regulator [Methylocystaceae bacterium]